MVFSKEFLKRWFSTDSFSGVLSQLEKHSMKGLIQPVEAPPQLYSPVGETVAIPPNRAEVEENVSRTINALLEAQSVWQGMDPTGSSLHDERLTPAQRFYLENKELLVRRATEYSLARASSEFEKATQEIEDDWAFYRDPIVRPRRGHLWPVSDTDEQETSESSGNKNNEFENDGVFPRIEEFTEFLLREQVLDILTVDLNLCGRRDIGEWAVIGTVKSFLQAERVGNLVRRAVNKLGLANIKTFINALHGQEWIVVRAGPVVVHLMTAEDRAKYALEQLYATVVNPEEAAEEGLDDLVVSSEDKIQ
jgi:ribosomal silencing factor RsfS